MILWGNTFAVASKKPSTIATFEPVVAEVAFAPAGESAAAHRSHHPAARAVLGMGAAS